jgi:hypothetical protein
MTGVIAGMAGVVAGMTAVYLKSLKDEQMPGRSLRSFILQAGQLSAPQFSLTMAPVTETIAPD